MSRIKQHFDQLKTEQKKAFIPFITAGYPDCATTVTLMHALVESGANIIELGMPFSDPMADGPAIQQANQYALEHGITLDKVLQCVQDFRKTDSNTPIVLMGYLNPIEHRGYDHFAKQAAAAGVDGCLIVDCPPEEAESINQILTTYDIDLIYLIAPNTPRERVKLISEHATGYLYIVAYKGITGTDGVDTSYLAEELAAIRSLTNLPLAIGFGIKDAQTARPMAEISDAVIVGSALINIIHDNVENPAEAVVKVGALAKAIRVGMD